MNLSLCLRVIKRLIILGPILQLAVGCGTPASTPSATGQTNTTQQVGGVDGGGGDLPQSTEGQVRAAVAAAFSPHLEHVFYNLALRATLVDDPYVKRVMAKFYDNTVGQKNWVNSQPIFIDIKKTKFNLVEEGGCLERNGRTHPMGVAQFALAEPICVSIPLLRSVPDNELTKQIVGLFVHEFAHHFGFGEFDASKIQHYVLRNYDQLAWFPEEISVKLSDVELVVDALQRWRSNFFLFQGGKNVEKIHLDETEPYCQLEVFYQGESSEKSVGTKKQVRLRTGDISVRLHHRSSSASCDAKGCGVRSMGFHVNRVWGGNYWNASGAQMQSDGELQASIMGITCIGLGLKHMDIPLAFERGDL